MASIFDPSVQSSDIDSKIAASLERLSHAFRVLLWRKHGEGGFSPLQVQVLVHLSFRSEEGRSVGELARELHLTPATMSDALATLEARKLLARRRRSPDRRVVHVRLTPRGRKTAGQLADWAGEVRKSVGCIDAAKKPELLCQLLSLINSLQTAGVISLTRMCFSCRHLAAAEGSPAEPEYFCRLLGSELRLDELRLDCPEHQSGPSSC